MPYAWRSTVAAPNPAELEAGLVAARTAWDGPQSRPINAMARGFAGLAGVEPDLAAWPNLERALLFDPLSAVSFGLSEPDALPEASQRTREAAAALRRITGPAFEPEEQGLRDLVRGAFPQTA